MEKVAVFLADGFEEIEGLAVVDLLRRAEIETDMVSIMGRVDIQGSHNICLKADMLLENINADAYDMMVLPGGGPGTQNLKACKPLNEMVVKHFEKGKYVAAICAAPTALGQMGILKGKKACCYGGLEQGLTGAEVSFDNVVVDGNVITSRGMGTAIEFGLKLVEIYKGAEKAKALSDAIMIKG